MLCVGAHENRSCFECLSCCFHGGKQHLLWFLVPPSLCLHFEVFVLCHFLHTLSYCIFIFNSLFVSLSVDVCATVSFFFFVCLWVTTNGDRYCGLNPQKQPQSTFWFILQCFSSRVTIKTFSNGFCSPACHTQWRPLIYLPLETTPTIFLPPTSLPQIKIMAFSLRVPARHLHKTIMWIFQLSSAWQSMTMPKRQHRGSCGLLGKLKTQCGSLKMIEKNREEEKKSVKHS